MSIRVYGADQNPATDHFLYRCSCSSGASVLASGRGLCVIDGDGRRAVQLLHGADTCRDAFTKEIVGLSALLHFVRVLNPLIAPQKLHYETPMAGDGSTFARHRRKLIKASGRGRTGRAVLAAMQQRAAAIGRTVALAS